MRTFSCSGWLVSWRTPRRRSCTARPRTRGAAGGGGGGAGGGGRGGGAGRPPARAPPAAWPLFALGSHCPPPAIARVEDYHAADWESAGPEAIVPRSSLNPILHF